VDRVCLLALAGGPTGPSEDDVLGCCGLFVILPAVVLLILVAWVADSPWAGWMAVAVAGITYLLALLLVAGYKSSDDPEVAMEQAAGRSLEAQYGWLTVAALGSLGAVGARRVVRWLWPPKQSRTRHLTAAERLAVVQEIESRGLVSAEEADGLRRRLMSSEAETQDAEPDAATGDSHDPITS